MQGVTVLAVLILLSLAPGSDLLSGLLLPHVWGRCRAGGSVHDQPQAAHTAPMHMSKPCGQSTPFLSLPFANYSCKSWNLEFLLLSDITLGGWREILDI